MNILNQWTQDGFDLVAEWAPDEAPDVSWLGSYHQTPAHQPSGGSEQAFKVPPVQTRDGYLFRSPQPCYFRPQRGCEDGWEVAEKRLRAYYLDEWAMMVLGVHAEKNGVRLGSAYLGGFGSDDEAEAIRTAQEDLASEAIDEAVMVLDGLCLHR